jgi:hypothetical protein
VFYPVDIVWLIDGNPLHFVKSRSIRVSEEKADSSQKRLGMTARYFHSSSNNSIHPKSIETAQMNT